MLNERFDEIRFMLQTSLPWQNQSLQLRKCVTGDVGQLNDFHVAPNPLDGVQVRRIAWQLLEMEASSSTLSQIGFEFLRAVSRTVVPHDQQSTGNALLQETQKLDHFLRRDRLGMRAQEQLALQGDRSQYRQMISRQELFEQGCQAP